MTKKKSEFWILFEESVMLFKNNWLFLFTITACLFAAIFAIDYLYWNNEQINMTFIASGAFLTLRILDLLASLLAIILLFLYFIILIKVLHISKTQGVLKMGNIFKESLGMFWPYFYVKILYLSRILLWSLLLVIPGIIFGIFYSFSGLAFIIEGKRGKEALKYSKAITGKHFNKFLDYFLFAGAYAFVLFGAPILLLQTAFIYSVTKGYNVYANIIDGLQTFIASIGLVFLLVFFYCLFMHLKLPEVEKSI